MSRFTGRPWMIVGLAIGLAVVARSNWAAADHESYWTLCDHIVIEEGGAKKCIRGWVEVAHQPEELEPEEAEAQAAAEAAAQAAAEAAAQAAAEAAAAQAAAEAAQEALDAAEDEAEDAARAEEEAAAAAAAGENLLVARRTPGVTVPDLEAEPELPQVHGVTWDARVEVRATAETWIVVTDGVGNEIFSGILNPGDMILIPNQGDVVMTAGDAGALNILVDGDKLNQTDAMAGTVTNVTLGAEALLADEFLAEVAMQPNRIAGLEAR